MRRHPSIQKRVDAWFARAAAGIRPLSGEASRRRAPTRRFPHLSPASRGGVPTYRVSCAIVRSRTCTPLSRAPDPVAEVANGMFTFAACRTGPGWRNGGAARLIEGSITVDHRQAVGEQVGSTPDQIAGPVGRWSPLLVRWVRTAVSRPWRQVQPAHPRMPPCGYGGPIPA